ncbi:MAG: protein-methionine-sulfoxide reductase catalytic subunit MsrP [Casimicrobiaceae bacterium]|nr:protein-methionine-sulfoxide reductase catalytic subunit MsrP [Casimicrobiaceae bacterium]
MRIRWSDGSAVKPSEITPRGLFELEGRRRWLAQLAGLGLFGALPHALGARAARAQGSRLAGVTPNPNYRLGADEKLNKPEEFNNYCNFYEFGMEKTDPPRLAGAMRLRPWTVTVEGEVNKPQTIDVDALYRLAPLEERVYRLRCVEGWSMVIPWVGFPLSELIKRVEPRGNAKFVEFVTLADPQVMPGLKYRTIDWPYVEGLRMDEAMHPLTLLTLGAYGEMLAPQNGAPVRIVVPWKYGFKSGKSIVKIRFVEKQPMTAWHKAAPGEYGFYANVNPEVDHPRWSQRTERRIGEFSRRKTLLFNGYAEQVAHLYAGMDLRKFF